MSYRYTGDPKALGMRRVDAERAYFFVRLDFDKNSTLRPNGIFTWDDAAARVPGAYNLPPENPGALELYHPHSLGDSERELLEGDTEWVLVDPDDEALLRIGYSFGLEIDTARVPPLHHYDEPVPGMHNYHLPRELTCPRMLKWAPGAEAAAVKFLQASVIEGLVEIPDSSFSHWLHREGSLTAALEAADELTGANAEQEAARLKAFGRPLKAEASRNTDAAALATLRLRVDLAANFASAKTMDQTLAVCKRYLAGEFGVDWFARGYFDAEKMPAHAARETRVLDAEDETMRRHRDGAPATHYGSDAIRPMMKRLPDLARIYHVPREAE